MLKPDPEIPLSRKEFLILLAFWSGLASLGITLLDELKEPEITFKSQQVLLGNAKDYALNSVSFFPLHRAFLIRDQKGFYALKAVCTHLGCQPKWEHQRFVCPCHGSRFARDGKVQQGPALRSLERFHIFMTAQEQIGLELSRTYRPETTPNLQANTFLPWPG